MEKQIVFSLTQVKNKTKLYHPQWWNSTKHKKFRPQQGSIQQFKSTLLAKQMQTILFSIVCSRAGKQQKAGSA